MVTRVAYEAAGLSIAHGMSVRRCLDGLVAVLAGGATTFGAACLQAQVSYELVPFEAVEPTFKSIADITAPGVGMRRAKARIATVTAVVLIIIVNAKFTAAVEPFRAIVHAGAQTAECLGMIRGFTVVG